MAKQAVVNNLRMLKTLVIDFLVFKLQFSRRLSRVFFSASLQLSRNFRGWLAGLAQIAAAGRLKLAPILRRNLFEILEEIERKKSTNRSLFPFFGVFILMCLSPFFPLSSTSRAFHFNDGSSFRLSCSFLLSTFDFSTDFCFRKLDECPSSRSALLPSL